nr:hypothetical protein [Tanacetum cinerariifolium]
MEDLAIATDSSKVPSPIERSPLDFANKNPSQQLTGGNEIEDKGLAEESAAMGPRVIKERRKRGNDGVDTNAPPKALRRDHDEFQPTQSTIRGKSLAAMEIGMGSTCPAPTSWDMPVDVSDLDPLSFADPQSIHTENVAHAFNVSEDTLNHFKMRGFGILLEECTKADTKHEGILVEHKFHHNRCPLVDYNIELLT